jgi:hypothetical protein
MLALAEKEATDRIQLLADLARIAGGLTLR